MEEIILKTSEKRIIRLELRVSQSTINYALEGKRDTALTRIIRKRATEIVESRGNQPEDSSSNP